MHHQNENNGMYTENIFWLTILSQVFTIGENTQESSRTVLAERQVHIVSKFDIFSYIKYISTHIFWIKIYSGSKSQFQLVIPKLGPGFQASLNITGI